MTIDNSILYESVRSIRIQIILISIDNYKLQSKLAEGVLSSELDNTESLILRCATILKITEITKNKTFIWSDSFNKFASNETSWVSFINIVKHQISYLNILMTSPSSTFHGPFEQLDKSPDDYIRFLLGVHSSHTFHAASFAANPIFLKQNRLVDIGGGLGTFSYAWVKYNSIRTAIVIDFPKLASLYSDTTERVEFIGANLEYGFDFNKIEGDIFLFSNVIHLLGNWTDVIDNCYAKMQFGNILVVFEADAEDEHGTLFNYQVHMRSSFKSFLLSFNTINDKILSLNFHSITEDFIVDANDPYQRTYKLWICQK